MKITLSHSKRFIAMNKKRIGKWTPEDKKIKQLEDDLAAFSFKICNRVINGEPIELRFDQICYKITKKQAEIHVLRHKHLYQFKGDQNFEFF